MNPLSTWSLLVLTLPTENATARMRHWRALKARGCAAVVGIIAMSAYKLTVKRVGKKRLLPAIYATLAAVTVTGGTVTLIDTRTNRRLGIIELGGEAGNTQYDPESHHIFVNVQTRRQLAEIDPSTDTITSRIDLPGAKGNHGLAIVPQLHRAFIACEGNSTLLVLDMRTRRVTQSFDVGREPDVLAYDSGRDVLYVAGEAGVVSMFRVSGTQVSQIGEGFIGPNAHVIGVDAAMHRAYFPLKNVNGRPVLRIMALRPAEP